MEPWAQLIQTFGVAVACLMAMGFAIWRTMSWVAENVVRPAMTRHIKMLDAIEDALKQQALVNAQIAANVEKLSDDTKQIRSIVVRPPSGSEVEVVTQQRGTGLGGGAQSGGS